MKNNCQQMVEMKKALVIFFADILIFTWSGKYTEL